MSILMSIEEWCWLQGIEYDELSLVEQEVWKKKFYASPPSYISGRDANGNIFIRRTGYQKEYKTPELVNERRLLYKIPDDIKTGDKYSGGRWCDRHGCLHGNLYKCKYYSDDLKQLKESIDV